MAVDTQTVAAEDPAQAASSEHAMDVDAPTVSGRGTKRPAEESEPSEIHKKPRMGKYHLS